MKTKHVLAVLALLAGFVVSAAAQDARAIVQQSRDRIDAATIQSRSRWVIAAKNGSTTERLIDQYSKDDPDGASRIMIEFKQPAGVAGTRFLTLENKNGSNNQWIFLPSLGKVRRIAASEGSGSFMGTDLSYDDISSADREPDLDTHTLVREENYNGKACYVIESRPRDSSYQYSKMVQWIDKANKVNYKIELYDKKGAHIKTLETLEFKNVQGYLSPVKTRMMTLGSGTSTTINVEILRYGEPVPEPVFTTRYLETGNPR
ncbi:MAG: outer membrane lipoprotein-sorting protein [Treponema sp.]|jgi:outer membrane lipoprotein-sorting protein|nr:outer membrane lipoprotein-sorting protein [Treponema sp.]